MGLREFTFGGHGPHFAFALGVVVSLTACTDASACARRSVPESAYGCVSVSEPESVSASTSKLATSTPCTYAPAHRGKPPSPSPRSRPICSLSTLSDRRALRAGAGVLLVYGCGCVGVDADISIGVLGVYTCTLTPPLGGGGGGGSNSGGPASANSSLRLRNLNKLHDSRKPRLIVDSVRSRSHPHLRENAYIEIELGELGVWALHDISICCEMITSSVV